MLDIIKYPEEASLPLNWCIGASFSHHDDIIEGIIRNEEYSTIVEVGTFVGHTACLMAEMPEVEKVYIVDNWSHNLGRTINPQKQFFSNVIHKRLQDKIIPIKGISWKVGKQFQKEGIKADMVYIDAHHSRMSVRKDLRAWYPVGNFICGDDYGRGRHMALIEEVNSFAKNHNKKVHNIGKFWWYS